MNRTGLTISALIASLGAAKILFPSTIAAMFALDTAPALLALFTAVVAYGVWYGPLKFLSGSHLIGTAGLAALTFGAFSVISPTLLGTRSAYLPVADMFMLIESGIVLLMIGLEKKPKRGLSPLVVISLVWQVLQRRVRATAAINTAH